ncbi:MAG: FHA domain-containing protein [Pirellulales bacterium]|nr:FHA domain-containing protein [Pirellulales bacterium]
MDVILKVLEGAKTGAKIAIKKPEFTIGRSQSCSLCAGSSAISRQHCMITRDEARVVAKDLGSRNGTLVNGQKIEGEVELASGDEIAIGPLKFLITITPGINNAKQPEVKSVAEAVSRTALKPHVDVDDDDISKWLLGPSSALSETQTIRIDDTNAVQRIREAAEQDEADAESADPSEAETQALEGADDEKSEDSPKKSGPGKLPKLPPKPSAKDSREAAAEALRAWSRRR